MCVTARDLLKMKTRKNALVIHTMSRKDHLVLPRLCDRRLFVQITRKASVVDATLGAMTRCHSNSIGK